MIILASTSPRRKQLLETFGLEFKIVASEVDEDLDPTYKPKQKAELLSLQKAEAVAQKFTDVIVIGADTVVALGETSFGKPKDVDDAKKILQTLSGKTHVVITGFTIIDTKSKKKVTKSVETKVWFRKVTDSEIDNYIEKAKPFDKAGSYALQDLGALFIEKVEGDYLGAVGLPLFALAKELKNFGVTIL